MAEIKYIRLDKKLQIIKCCVTGIIEEQDAIEVYNRVEREVEKTDDPTKVNIVTDARKLGKPTTKARRKILEALKNNNIHKYAFWGLPVHMQLFLSILFRASGMRNIDFYKTEAEAIQWIEK